MSFSRLRGALLGALLILPVASCGTDNRPTAQDVASLFLASLANGDNAGAAGQTDAPWRSRTVLDTTRRNLAPKAVSASVTNVTEGDQRSPTTATFDITWDFGNGRVWRYPSSMELAQGQQGWKVRWAPSVIHPRLAAQQTLAFRERTPELAPVLDRDGRRLMGPEQLVSVIADKRQTGDSARVAGSLAGALSAIDPRITQQSIMDGLAKTPDGKPYVVATLRQSDYQRVKAQVYELPGVRFSARNELVAAERGYGSQVLPSIAKGVEDQVAGKAGWQVVTVNTAGAEVASLGGKPPLPAQAVSTTLSDRVQTAAEHAVDPMPRAAMVVALRPSSGDVLAVAQNQAADNQGSLALTGQYPPGSTFKMITAASGLDSGRVTMDTPVQCPAKKTFDGRIVPNDKEFDLGTVPLRTAFAKSCNTSFAQLAADLPGTALTETAKKLGVGVDYEIPGITTITGKVPGAHETVQRAENGIGQGTVVASPFGMALATASVARGSTPSPTLLKGTRSKASAAPPPPSPRSLEQLRTMMREVVTSGTATALAGSGEVAGKTGTAQFGDGTHAHGWFVGYRGDLAFAVLVTDAGASGPAVEIGQRFLSNADRGR